MSTKTIVVVGGTGRQGASVIDSFIGKQGWNIRAVTRNPTSPKSQTLTEKGVEVIKADLRDIESLKAAFKDANAIYAVTDFWEPFFSTPMSPEETEAYEVTLGKNIVDAASAISTLEHFIWSTLPACRQITNSAFSVPHCDGKAQIDEYIKESSLKSKTTYLIVATYIDNIYSSGIFLPMKLTQGKKRNTNIVLGPCSPNTVIEVIDTSDIGAFVSAIINNPTKTLEKYVFASNGEKDTTQESVVQLAAKYSGFEDVKYIETTPQAFDVLYPKVGLELGVFFKFFEKVGGFTGGRYDLTAKDLGIEGLKTLEDVLKTHDWAPILAEL